MVHYIYGVEDELTRPSFISNQYEYFIPPGIFKPIQTNIVIEEIFFTLAYEDELTLEENDIASFCAKSVLLNFNSIRNPVSSKSNDPL